MERLQKIIAASGIASRRKAEELILAGKVRVNGKIVRTLGTLADATNDAILVSEKPLPKVTTVVYAVNKPRGVVCSRKQQADERIITDLVPAFPAVYPVGRLDKESEGLILLTNDGKLAQRLTHPSFEHQKEYRVLARKEERAKDAVAIAERLKKGVWLGDGKASADSVEIKELPGNVLDMTIIVHEGRQHLIRRMCASVDLKVTRLTRVKLGTITLKGLASGRYRTVTAQELSTLHEPSSPYTD